MVATHDLHYLVRAGHSARGVRRRPELESRASWAFADERDRHRVGAHAVARDAAGGVGGAHEGNRALTPEEADTDLTALN